MSKTVVVVAAHADDEALGCGGTMARHAASGDRVHVVYVADGVSARPGAGADDAAQRQAAMQRACAILGVESTTSLGLPDNRLDSLALLDIVQPLEAVLGRLLPDTVYTHHHGDLNVDHRLTHQAVMTACRPMPGASVREILCFEVMSSTEWNSPDVLPFLPNLFVDISEHLDAKMRALAAYSLEMRDSPHARSMDHLRALAQHRGHCVGFDAAEAFAVMRVLRG